MILGPEHVLGEELMYTTFFRYFGLRENPFNVNPDPRYLFVNQRTQSILEDMASAIEARKGLIVLTGEAGTGKTTVINRLKQWLQKQQTPTAFIFNPRLEVNELFDLMLASFGISAEARSKGSALARLNGWLIERRGLGMNAVLILDEAQVLPANVLEEIRMLLNHEMPQEKLLQIVLSGQPELEDKLRRRDLRQIRQRIILQCQTLALTSQEAHQYVQTRLQIAGGMGGGVFMPEAIDAAYLYSRGIPRVMNLLCEQAMIRGFSEETRPVPASMVGEGARYLQLADLKPVNSQPGSEMGIASATPASGDAANADGKFGPLLDASTPILVTLPKREPASVATPDQADAGAAWDRWEISATGHTEQPETEAEAQIAPASAGRATPFRVQRAEAMAQRTVEPSARPPIPPKKMVAAATPKHSRPVLDFSLLRARAGQARELVRGLTAALSSRIAAGWRRTVAARKSLAWQKNLASAVRWLRQPLPTVKLHRRADH